jgi:hypothetical protein
VPSEQQSVFCSWSRAWQLRRGFQAIGLKQHAGVGGTTRYPAIASWAENKNWRAQEIEILTNRTTEHRVIEEGWLTDKMILMRSGEWLIYKSHCPKEKPRLVKDIFLAKGSDGKWYYSTFHFCVGMVWLRGEQETQPPDLAMFVHEYNLRQFDGRSDECLKETGTFPASWREKNRKEGSTP